MTEKWIWEQNCIGLTANLNRYFGEEADPLYPDHWTENRRITQGFMETILLHQPWHGALHRQGVRIIGAWFHEGLTLDGATLPRQLWLTHSRFEENVWLNQIKAKRKISFNGSFFAKDLPDPT